MVGSSGIEGLNWDISERELRLDPNPEIRFGGIFITPTEDKDVEVVVVTELRVDIDNRSKFRPTDAVLDVI